MKKRMLIGLIVIIVLIAILSALIGYFVSKGIAENLEGSDDSGGSENSGNSEIPLELYCESDRDCVPSSCCHATSCVASGYQQDCSGMFCTQECSPGTMDCGQGSCLCQNNRCKAVFR